MSDRWEYMTLQATREHDDYGSYMKPVIEEDLNAFGAEGWEAVTARFYDDFGIAEVLLKRRVKEQDDG
jgi:hypothetical protein